MKYLIFSIIILIFAGCGSRFYSCKGQICDHECHVSWNSCKSGYTNENNKEILEKCEFELYQCVKRCGAIDKSAIKYKNDIQCKKLRLNPFHAFMYSL